jgi:hypothetical protein
MIYYAYKEVPKDERHVEFGWVPVSKVSSGFPVVVSKSLDDPGQDNVATLADYQKFFKSLTNSTPDRFLEKWKPYPSEYRVFWYSHMPKTEENTHQFILSLADLIVNKKSFSHSFAKRTATYEILDEWNEAEGGKAGN